MHSVGCCAWGECCAWHGCWTPLAAALAPGSGDRQAPGLPRGHKITTGPRQAQVRGPLLNTKAQPVVPDAGTLQDLMNHMENRYRKRSLRKDCKTCPGNAKPCPRTVLISPWHTPVLPHLASVKLTPGCLDSCSCAPLFRVRQGKPCKDTTWKNSRGASLQAACRYAGREVGRGSGRKTKPGTSHGAQGQAETPWGLSSSISTVWPKFLMQMANRTNT